jgi:hypothetical protein
MVCISLVYCNGVRMCIHPLWTEAVHACRCSIDRRCAAWCGTIDSSVSVAISGERRHSGTDSPATASRQRRSGLFTVHIHCSCKHNHGLFNRVLYTKKMHLNEMNPFWLSVLSFVWYTSSISFESVLNEFVKFIAHGPSFKFPFMSSFNASFHTTFVL